MRKRVVLYILLSAVALFVFIGGFALWKLNTYELELNIPNKPLVLEYGVDRIPEVSAICRGKFFHKQGFPIEVKMKEVPTLKKLGSYEITFVATYRDVEISEKRTVMIVDTTAPVIELVSDPEHFTSPVKKYKEEGFTATDNFDGDITDKVVAVEKDGIVTYTVKDSSGNTATAERTIVYKDVVPPVISLKGGEAYKFTIGNDFKDPGFSAKDDCDGNLKKKVSVEGSVDGHTEGTYELTYTVKDSSDNETKVVRTVTVGDFEAPQINLKGDSEIFIKINGKFKDAGFTATDNVDGDVADKVKVSGKVNTSKTGPYKITYKVSDKAGNKTKVTRSIYVYKKQAAANPTHPGDKVVYLTFDDGPGPYTQRLLDILDKYEVKATFFVTNQFPKYQNMIGKTYRKGHTIALHTYSHNYSDVYSSEENYFKDLEKIKKICIKQTGSEPTIVRFPGGTNNTVSRNYCKGIMTTLSKTIKYHGYYYCDWNVSSGDAGETTSSSGVAKNVIAGIKRNNVSVVLQHDIKSYSVEAVDDIIKWGIKNGYTFLPLTETSPMIHFSPLN